ncbi:MAG TPA: ABC transporter ATP-binding protein [Cyclobacteriaceae bacterium]|nr:ABC transporter ATP-binding protein [Cyclobacteriaceae bacterium]
MNALVATNITKRYINHLALDQVDLTIPEQSIFGLLGPNGAGKTTFIRIINQIINPDEGEISIFGSRLNEAHISSIGYLPEERGLYKKMKVGDQLVYLAQLKGMNRKEAVHTSKVWVKKFDIADWWNKKVEDLSKGMAQKVQFISTVMHEPKLIILDEPFSGFDPVNAKIITDEIFELRDKGSTIIFSTHRMETVEELCDHIALINKSKKILEGPKKRIKETYRSNTFIVHHLGSFELKDEGYKIVQRKTVDENCFHTTITILNNDSPNKLISRLIDVTEVHSFIEKIPTMSEIFINLVKDADA